ncbi:hypothetical protein LUW74_20725 [Actinomadura madurae]|uniref:hypothetical protein n=1 Tax=Actinomadura madurae TaxID=1993 RepID=UPI0020261A98|nr:hypothetical protein [Actinomadura madurae]URN05495.1 hypothetical protein LUW74_20725 [Actinomadura madurae]
MSVRKFPDEFGLSLVVSPAVFGRQKELEKEEMPSDPPCHLYIVSQQPRLSFAPNSAHFEGGEFRCIFRVQEMGEFAEFPVTLTVDTGGRRLEVKSEWPYDEFKVVDTNTGRDVFKAPVALFVHHVKSEGWPDIAYNQEILYIGQAFGKAGERTAFDRLKSHATLQRIYSEVRADKEIWLSLCSISDVAMLQSMAPPRIPVSIANEDANKERRTEMLRWYYSGEFRDKEAVALAEAALIRYFQPEYNKIFRDNFPDPAHVSSRKCYDLEINTLAIELHGYLIDTRYWSSTIEPNTLHVQAFPLFSEQDRKNMFDMFGND